MKTRKIGGHVVPEVGVGCMNLSHAYGVAPAEEDGIRLLHTAFDLGVRHFDTAALYGFGRNETLVGKALKDRRSRIYLASKCALGDSGQRVIDGRPETLLKTIDQALERLQTDYIDLYYLHRWDKRVPIEESIGALVKMKEQGKIREIGVSEVSAGTLRKAHAVHPVAAIQTEYSLWSRNAEIAVLDTCRELDIAFVAFSPLARGFLCGNLEPSAFVEKDIRRNMPRFQEPHFGANRELLAGFLNLAERANCSPGQLALSWVLNQGDHIIPIPGTRSIEHLEENLQAAEMSIDDEILRAAGELINQHTVTGPRYPAPTQAEIDTEQFASELTP